MKISWIAWWLVNVFWIVLFAVGTVFVWTREIDGTGAIQTPEAKMLSFIIQVVWLILNLVCSRKGEKKNGLSA